MDIQPNRYINNEMIPGPIILKEVTNPAKKKQLYQLSDKMAPLIIDYGSQTIKAGYDVSQCAQLVFRPQVSKNRDPSRVQLPTKASINTSYDQLDFAKQNYKSLYERNIILHFSILEQCNDYLFSELIRPSKKIRSNLIISQPFANPIHCRESVLELLFQCYQIQNVMIGVDALFAYFYQIDCNIDRYEKQTALVIHMGANTVHELAIVDGKTDYSSVRRINIGGNQSFELFAKTLLLKNPQLKTKLTYGFLRDIYEKFTSVAIDYKEQLRYFSKKYKMQNNIIYRNRIVQANKQIEQNLKFIEGIQIDFDTIIQIPEEEIKRKQQIRQRMAEKLKQTIIRRKQMKKRMHEHQLQTYLQLKKKYEDHDLGAHEEVVQIFGNHKPHQKLVKKIKALQLKLGLVQQKTDDKKFALIDIPDHELPPEKLKFKRMQIYQKKAMEDRRQKQKQQKQEQERMKNLRQNNPQIYLQQLKQKFLVMSNKAKERERLKAQMGDRKSKFNKRKMQVIARLAQEQFNQEMFQAQEQEMKEFAQEQDSDHYSQLQVMQAELRQIDPQYQHSQKDQHHLKQSNQLFLYTDLIKCHQIYFEPQLIGTNQTDIIESIVHLLRPYSNDTKQKLLKNIIICGGGSEIKGLKQRVYRELRKECPVQMQIQVKIGKGGSMGAFMGMQQIGRSQKQFLQKMSYRREDFLQKGKIQFVANPWSNPRPCV